MHTKKRVIILAGVPASGKSWVINQLKHSHAMYYDIVQNDDWIGRDYAGEVARVAGASLNAKPVLCEAPFSVSDLKNALEDRGFTTFPKFIIETPEILIGRWTKRATPERIWKGHLTRQKTFLQRAKDWGVFNGTSAEMLKHLTT